MFRQTAPPLKNLTSRLKDHQVMGQNSHQALGIAVNALRMDDRGVPLPVASASSGTPRTSYAEPL